MIRVRRERESIVRSRRFAGGGGRPLKLTVRARERRIWFLKR